MKTEIIQSQKEENIRLLDEGFMRMRVYDILTVTNRIKEYELYPLINQPLDIEPGCSISVAVKDFDGNLKLNSYSLLNGPRNNNTLSIAVQEEKEGQGGSYYMHHSVRCGDILLAKLNKSYFNYADNARKNILCAGGIGITPIISIMQFLNAQKQQFELHYAAKTKSLIAYKEFVSLATWRQPYFLYFTRELHPNSMNFKKILNSYDEHTHLYLCGPHAMLEDALSVAERVGWPKEQIHYERFSNTSEDHSDFKAQINSTGQVLNVSGDQSLLDVLLKNKIKVGARCKTGMCGSCRVKVLEGDVIHHDEVLDPDRRDQGIMCSCVSRGDPSTPLILDL